MCLLSPYGLNKLYNWTLTKFRAESSSAIVSSLIHKLSDFVELFESLHPSLSPILDYDIQFD